MDIKWFPLCQHLYLIICVLRVSQHRRTISLLTNDQQRTRRSVKARNAWLKDNYKRLFVQRAVSIRLSRGYGREGEERTKKKKEIRGTRVRKSKNIRKPSFRSLRSRKSLVALKVQEKESKLARRAYQRLCRVNCNDINYDNGDPQPASPPLTLIPLCLVPSPLPFDPSCYLSSCHPLPAFSSHPFTRSQLSGYLKRKILISPQNDSTTGERAERIAEKERSLFFVPF